MARSVTTFLRVLLLLFSLCTAAHSDTSLESLKELARETGSYTYKFWGNLGVFDTFSSMLSNVDIYYNRSSASHVARSLRLIFTEDRKSENLTTVRLKMLETMMQFFGLMSHVADQLYKPFGPVECGLLSEDECERNALPSISDAPKKIVRGLEKIGDTVCSGTYLAREYSLGDIAEACKSFNFPTILSRTIGTGCKDGVNSTTDQCLLLAIAEHTNYTDDAIRYYFKKAFGKYAYIAVNIKSFCFEFIEDNATYKIGKLIKENEDYVDDLWTGIEAIKRFPTGITLGLDVDSIANAQYKAIENKLTEHGWTGRQELHKKIVENTVWNLSAKYGDRYTFYVLAFLPYNQESQQCVESIPNRYVDGRLIDASQANLNFFVRGSSSEKLCKRLARVLYDKAGVNFEETDGGVGAFAAIKCGYHFVWYQLAYAYFPAAVTNSPYTLEDEGNKYDAKCGQLILFP